MESVPHSTGSWRTKAHRLIGEMSQSAYHAANVLPNGRIRKRHVPYTLPRLADDLVAALDNDDEMSAKAIFVLLAFSPDAAKDR